MVNKFENFKEIKIKDYEECPCGSKLNFRDCCKNKGYIYGAFEKNYKNEQVVYNETKRNLRAEQMVDIMRVFFDEHIEATLSVSNGVECLNQLYNIYDQAYAEVERYYTCTMGCSHCCELYVECTALEAENIRRYTVEHLQDRIQDFKKYIEQNKHKVPSFKEFVNLSEEQIDTVTGEYQRSKLKCPFLSEDNKCLIYIVRPINCRKHMVSSSENECLPDRNNAFIRHLSEGNVIQMTIPYIQDKIARYANLKCSGQRFDGQIMPIYKSFYEWFNLGFDSINRENI